MPTNPLRALCFAALAIATLSAPLHAEISGVTFLGFSSSAPLSASHAPGDASQLLVAMRNGTIRGLDVSTGSWAPDPLVTVEGVDDTGEGGLLGLAFHPNYQANGKLYVFATIDPGDANPGVHDPFASKILEYTISGDSPPAVRTILEVDQPTAFHNGGWIGFNPAAAAGEEAYLYATLGDSDFSSTAQSITGELFGNVIRIDVNGDAFPLDDDRNYAIPNTNPLVGAAGEDEIFAYGLRNPYRASFDRATGDLWIGDVGAGAREEIDVIRTATGGGQNFGWDACEGLLTSTACDDLKAAAHITDPVYDYSHPGEGPSPPDFRGVSVTGGVVYRGPDPEVNGRYLFGDVFAPGASFWSLDAENPVGSIANLEDVLFPGPGGNTTGGPVGFAEDPAGNVYILTLGGGIYRIETDTLLPGDFNADGTVDAIDYAVWREGLGTTHTAEQYAEWRTNFGASAAQPAPASGTSTPEPSALLLLAIAAAWTHSQHRAKRLGNS